jgi:hypothetical protein
VHFVCIEVLLQVGCPYDTQTGVSAEERYIRDNNNRLRSGVTMNYRSMSDPIPYPILASTKLFSHPLNGLPPIYILLPDNLFKPFLPRMVLKLPMAGHAPITLSVVLNPFLLGVF